MIYVNNEKYTTTMTNLLITAYKHATRIVELNNYKKLKKSIKSPPPFFET